MVYTLKGKNLLLKSKFFPLRVFISLVDSEIKGRVASPRNAPIHHITINHQKIQAAKLRASIVIEQIDKKCP